MTPLSLQERASCLAWATDNVADVVVVGGGITGAGVAREAALRGLRVVLVDQGDFASGTSSRSSKLIHGGLRYLAQGDVGLVKEAARERAVLRSLAPHLARPVRTLVPAASRAGLLKLQAGMWAFKKLAEDADDYATYGAAETLVAEPGLRPARLMGAVSYTEYLTDDARLTLETVQAAAGAGARVANYAAVIAMEREAAGVRLSVSDRLSGEGLVLRARCVVNAAGPWSDRVRALSEPEAESRLRLTRGIHVSVPRDTLEIQHLVVLRASDGRPVFAVPNGRYTYIGTTDTAYEGSPDEPGVTREDVRYLLDAVATSFRTSVNGPDIVGTWSGVRPLIREPGKRPSEISRRDEIRRGPGPLVSVAGGKLTTYRRMAERVLNEVCAAMGRSMPEANSTQEPLAGGSAEAQCRARAASPRLPIPMLEDRLWATYGTAAACIVARIAREPELGASAGGLHQLTIAEIDHCVQYEMVASLDDLLRRRCSVAMFDTRAALAAAPAIAELLGDRLGWHADRRKLEADRFSNHRRTELETARAA